MSLPPQAARSDEALAPARSAHRADPAPWMAGMTSFAGILLIITGVFNAIEGLVALFQNEVYVAGREYVFAFDLTAWGWTHLILGAVVAAAGFGVMSGQVWGRACSARRGRRRPIAPRPVRTSPRIPRPRPQRRR